MILPFLVLPALFNPQGASADAVLAKIRHAAGFDRPLTQDLLLTGNATRMTVDGPFTLRIGKNGEYVYEFRSIMGAKVGFDGKTLWQADRTGATRVLSFGNEDREKSTAMLLTGTWLIPGAPLETKLIDGNTISIRLKGSEVDSKLSLDPATSLPTKATFETEAGLAEVDFSDWREADGHKLPFTVVLKEGGVSDEIHLSNATTALPDQSSFAMPSWSPKDVAFDHTIPAALETKRLRSGHIIVHPLVNGKDIGWFILDSGAEAMCIDKTGADELALRSAGRVPAVGVGGVVQVPFRLAKEFKLGSATYRDLAFLELDLAQIGKMLGLKLGGIVGYDVFRRSVVAMDVQKPQVSLYDPATYELPAGRWQAIKFDGGNIGVEGKFEGGRAGWFRLDTGAGGTVAFHSPFVEKYHLLDGREVAKSQEGGVGGMVESRRGVIDYFDLAGHRFDKPTVTFSLSKVGAMANKWLVGNIGQEFMNPFVMVFDYPHSRMAFEEKK